MRSASGTTSGDFLQRPLFSGSLRVAMTQRIVEVRYQTVFEMISEVSGSWAVSLGCGYLFALLGYGLVHSADLKMMCMPALQALGLCDAGGAVTDMKSLEPAAKEPKQLATDQQVTALKARLQRLEEALVKATGVELQEATEAGEATSTAEPEALSPPAEP